jgi:transcriptional regulator with XRE-family HTH domain
MNIVVGNKLKQYRNEKGWTQEQAADFLHVSQSTYARMESELGHSWANHVEKICRVFQVTSEELLKIDAINTPADNKQHDIVPLDLIFKKLIAQYEQRIQELKETIDLLRKKIKK